MGSKPKPTIISPSFVTNPGSPDIDAYRNFTIPTNSATTLATDQMNRLNKGEDVSGFGFAAPINQRYARAGKDVENSYNSAYSGVGNPVLRQNLIQSQKMKLNEAKGQELGNAAANEQQFWTGLSAGGQQDNISALLGQKDALARLTSPQLASPTVIPGQPGIGSQIAGGAASAGISAALAA